MKRAGQWIAVLSLGVALCGVLADNAVAQVGGDLRNVTLNIGKMEKSDLALTPQVDDDGNVVVTGGVTVKEGDKVSFNYKGTLETATAGFWIGETGKTYFVEFRDTDDFCIAYGKVKGEVRWDKSRKLTVGKDNFLELKMRFEPNATWHPITKTEIVTDGLRLTTNDGRSFKVFRFSSDISAVIEEEKRK